MAAPMWQVMRLGISQVSKPNYCSFGTTCRRFISRYRRRAVAVLTPEDESRKIVESDNVRIRNPRADRKIDYGYAADDPVLDTLSLASQHDKQNARVTERRAFSAGVSKPNLSQRSSFGNTKKASIKTNKSIRTFDDDEEFTYRKRKNLKSDTRNHLESQMEKTPKKKQSSVKKSGKFPPVDNNVDKSFYWDLDGMKYSVLKDGDKKFGRALKDVKSKNLRDQHKQILLEGRRLIEDGLMAGGNMLALFFTQDDALLDLKYRDFDAPIYKIYRRHMNIWSDTVTPPGILAIFEMPESGHVFQSERKTIPLTLVLDKIKDPGNMGTLIRTAAAVGCQSVITVKGCVDVWDPKVVRSGAGCHFRVPLYRGLRWAEVAKTVKKSSTVYISDKRRATDTRLQSYKFSDHSKYQELLLMQDQESDSDVDYDDLESDVRSSKQNYISYKDKGLYLNAPIPLKIYNDVNYSGKDNIVMIVGGEIHGVSAEARKLAFDHYGECLTIPMCEGVESLNAAIAGSLLMYEVHRQIGTKSQQVVQDQSTANDNRINREATHSSVGDLLNRDDEVSLNRDDEVSLNRDDEVSINRDDKVSLNKGGEVLLNRDDENLSSSDEILLNKDGEVSLNRDDEILLNRDDEVSLNRDDEVSLNRDDEVSLNRDGEVLLNRDDENLNSSDGDLQSNDEILLNKDGEVSLNRDDEVSLNRDDEVLLNRDDEDLSCSDGDLQSSDEILLNKDDEVSLNRDDEVSLNRDDEVSLNRDDEVCLNSDEDLNSSDKKIT